MQYWHKHGSLFVQLLKRDITSRYRGSLLGVLWSLLTPIMMLAMYTFVFQTVFKSRWSEESGATHLGFAIILFLGLSIHTLLSDVLNKSPTLILNNQNFVKKIVFPLEILSSVTLASAGFTFFLNLLILFGLIFFENHTVPLTAIYLPLILFPYFILLLGLGWFLAALGVYLRDIQQVMGAIATLLLFLSPVFYSASGLPEFYRTIIVFNPLTLVVESARDALIFGRAPDIEALLKYFVVAIVVALVGGLFFRKVRPGFADIL